MPQRRRPPAVASVPDLSRRVQLALGEGRSQRALELAKALFAQEPTPGNRELLRRSYLARGQELRERGAERDSTIVLKAALESQGDDSAWLSQVAEQLALSGAIQEVLALVPRLPEAARDHLLELVADAAVWKGPASRSLLPEGWQAEYDRILQAFAFSDSGQDEKAREILAGLGLRSPFLEWKLLLRGLLAYYAGADDRATENWQRLSHDRFSARLAAPFRQAIDPIFRAAQPPATQALLKRQFDRLQGSVLGLQMRGLLSALADKENLAPAFRQAEALLPELRRTAPALVDRLASVFYWAIMESGPDDIPRYQRVFGRPPNDPQFDRLQALAYERGGDFAGAHKHWQKYERAIAADRSHWPTESANRARALIWVHMGRNAATIPGASKLVRIPRHLREFPGTPRPLRPTTENCFRRATELAPDLLEPYEDLFEYFREEETELKAVAAARQLLERFPDHVPTLEALADIYTVRDEQAEALELYERALRGNPLDRQLRAKTAAAHLGRARLHAVDDRIDPARAEVRAALALEGGTPDQILLCRSAAVELKAGNDSRVEELLSAARERAGSELTISYRMLTEVARLKLPKSAKTRFESEFAAGLASPPSGSAATGLAVTAAVLSEALTYVGQKSHVKKILTYLEKAKKACFTGTQLQDMCQALLQLGSVRLANHFISRGQAEFPANPFFPYLAAEAYFQKGLEGLPGWKIRPLLEKAERLARALHPTEQLTKILDNIAERLKALAVFDPLAMGMIDDLFGGMFGAPDDEFED